MNKLAYSYLRFSTPEQAGGDSHRRQLDLARTYAARHGLLLDAGLSFRDLGMSAFHGRNVREGALRAFLAAVELGGTAARLGVVTLSGLIRSEARLVLAGIRHETVPPYATHHAAWRPTMLRPPILRQFPQDVADYLAGRGMGLARAAEMNQHPGPAHVIELRDKLALTPEQEAAARAAFTRMEAAAKALGAELVERERTLDQAFAQRAITDTGLAEQTAAIGMVQGRVRDVHLAAHIAMRHILTPEQVTRYDELRGYAGNPTTSTPAQHGHGSQAH